MWFVVNIGATSREASKWAKDKFETKALHENKSEIYHKVFHTWLAAYWWAFIQPIASNLGSPQLPGWPFWWCSQSCVRPAQSWRQTFFYFINRSKVSDFQSHAPWILITIGNEILETCFALLPKIGDFFVYSAINFPLSMHNFGQVCVSSSKFMLIKLCPHFVLVFQVCIKLRVLSVATKLLN